MITLNELWEAYKTVCADLLAERTTQGYWEGRLASSALATATAIGALSLVLHHRKASEQREMFRRVVPSPTDRAGRASGQQPHSPDPSERDFPDPSGPGPPWPSESEPTGQSAVESASPSTAEIARVIHAGLEWLAQTQNPDGGWGDTDRSPSNIATTMLVRAAVHLADLLDENCRGMGQIDRADSDGNRAGLSSLAGYQVGPCGSGGASGGSAQAGQPISFHIQKPTQRFARPLERAVRYIEQQGGLEGLRRRYGKDQTFAVPILTMYAWLG
mgnify:CR=1 FL=1